MKVICASARIVSNSAQIMLQTLVGVDLGTTSVEVIVLVLYLLLHSLLYCSQCCIENVSCNNMSDVPVSCVCTCVCTYVPHVRIM